MCWQTAQMCAEAQPGDRHVGVLQLDQVYALTNVTTREFNGAKHLFLSDAYVGQLRYQEHDMQ